MNTALGGVQSAQQAFDRAARQRNTASSMPAADPQSQPPDTVDLSAAAIALLVARNNYTANLHTLDTVVDLEKNVLDILG